MLLRDSPAGPEVLLLQRPSDRGSFPGYWVFPGGGLDPVDGQLADAETPRRAAIRETWEETGLLVQPAELVALSRWDPPLGIPKRMSTWFFVAVAPAGAIVLDRNELVDHVWLTPVAALDRHQRGELTLAPPTWLTLRGLTGERTAAEAVERIGAEQPEHFRTRHLVDARGGFEVWDGDAAYPLDADVHAPGPRHRLRIENTGWVYERSDRHHTT